MYESTVTDEDLELDRYGLGEGIPVSGTEDSDVEDFLYSQIHYNLTDNDKVQTEYGLSKLSNTKEGKDAFTVSSKLQNDNQRNISDCLEKKRALIERSPSGSVVGSDAISAVSGNLDRSGTTGDPDKRKMCISALTEAECNLKNRANSDSDVSGISIFASEGERDLNECNDSKYAVRKKTYQSKRNAKLPGNSDGSKTCDNENEVIDSCRSSDSDVIFLGRSLLPQKSVPLKSKQKETRQSVDEKMTTVTKINRDSLLPLPKKKRKRKRKEKECSLDEDDITAVDEKMCSIKSADDSRKAEDETNNDSDAIALRKTEQRKQRKIDDCEAGKENDSFFLDNKGMNLDSVKGEMADSETSWRKERERTKEMLRKEKGNLIHIVDSSDDEDCMVIESHSEDEDMQVHFDENADEKGTLEMASSGSWSEKRKKTEKKTEVRGRYFVQSRQRNIKCHNCFEVGHSKRECPKPRHIPACILCGTRGHTDKSCPDALCFNCSLPGHQSRSCKIRNMRYAHCNRCDMPGHVRKLCTDHWRQYHMTIENDVFLSPSKRRKTSMDQLGDTYCSNCSRKGHRYYDCSAARFDEFTTFTYDGVAKYDVKFKESQRSDSGLTEGPPAKRRALQTREVARTSNESIVQEYGYYETVHSIYRGVLAKQNPEFFSKSTGHGGEQHYNEVTVVQREPLMDDDCQMKAAIDQRIKEEDKYYEMMNSVYTKASSKVNATTNSKKRKRRKKIKDTREVEWCHHDDGNLQEGGAPSQQPQLCENLPESHVDEVYVQVDPQDERRQKKRKHRNSQSESGCNVRVIKTEDNLACTRDGQPEPSSSVRSEAKEDVSTTSCFPGKRVRKVIKTKVKAVLDLDKQQSKRSQNKGSSLINDCFPPVHGQGVSDPTSYTIHSASASSGSYPEGIPHRALTNPQITKELSFNQRALQNTNEIERDAAPQRSIRGFFLNDELLPTEQKQEINVKAGSTLQHSERQPKGTTQICPRAAPQMRSTKNEELAIAKNMQSWSDWRMSGFNNTFIKDLNDRNLLDNYWVTDINQLTEGEKKMWKFAEPQYHMQKKKKKPIQPPALNSTQCQPPAYPKKDSFANQYLNMSKKQRKVHQAQWSQYIDGFIVDIEKRNLWNGKNIESNRMTAEEMEVWKHAQNKFHKLRKKRARERQIQLGLPGPTKKQLKSQKHRKIEAKKQRQMLQSRSAQQVPATNPQASTSYAGASAMYCEDFPRNRDPSQNGASCRRSKRESKPSINQHRDCFVN